MFDEFKAKHGGLGPLQFALDVSTGGALSSRAQRAAIGEQMDSTLAGIQADDTITPELKKQAGEQLAHGIYTPDVALKNIDAIQAEQHHQHTIADAFAPTIAGARKLFDNAPTEEDRSILSTLLGQAESAQKLASDPSTRAEGMQLFNSVAQDVSKFTTQSKVDRITKEQQDATAARDLDKNQLGAYQNSREELEKGSAGFFKMRDAWNSASQLLQLKTPTSLSDQNLIRAAATILNPNATTRPGEDPGDSYYSALDAVPGLGAAVKYALTNGTLLKPEDRASLAYLLPQRVQTENVAQTERNTKALAEGKAEGLPDKYLNLLTTPVTDLGAFANAQEPKTAAPGAAPTTPKGPTTQSGAEPDTTGAMVGDSVGDAVGAAAQGVADFTGAVLGHPLTKLEEYQKRLRARTAAERPTDEFTQAGGL